MRVLVDVNHPAHAHFFKNIITSLRERGDDVVVTSRDKDCTLELLDSFGEKHLMLSKAQTGLFGLLKELIFRDWRLYKVVRRYRPDVMIAIGGTFITHTGVLSGTPSIVFYDTENASLQNRITYPFATKIYVPRCYQGWLPKGKGDRYPGYHELSYLQRPYFEPNLDIALACGLKRDVPNVLIRMVSWQANHDIGEKGWNTDLLDALLEELKDNNVIITSEAPLPSRYEKYRYRGHFQDIHHLLAFCRLYVGESATMASEAAVLGVPSVYCAETGRGYTDEQETRYKLVNNVRSLNKNELLSAVRDVLGVPEKEFRARAEEMLSGMVDMPKFVISKIEEVVSSNSKK
ncbi:hypothetical protein BTA51_25550 [Hahella sp. CCB-MM4]|uniref:DUF354 domain-containing protein n=1 Tax=Hahella sp. (strain CCB-MM4) TaxID=1926491 RepID=UPI000B9B00DA|nr:DUF354 domain-containing protein [Hahella sp. CCB-MM4]OZG70502.1 hypothetical protein BTA51_25550 [Hahella sp. CCB-MM4]